VTRLRPARDAAGAGDIPTTAEHRPVGPADLPPPAWQRDDLLVIGVALFLLAAGGLVHRVMTAPARVAVARLGLRFERPARLLPPVEVDAPRLGLAALTAGAPGDAPATAPTGREPPPGAALPIHEVYQSPDSPLTRLELLIDRRPDYRGLTMWLQLARQTRYGQYHHTVRTDTRLLRGHDWQVAEFQYAVAASEADAPQVATGIELATVNGGLLYIVTVHGTPDQVRPLEEMIVDTLAFEGSVK
jgi:hypothetical protein